MERPGLIDRATANVVEEFWVANDALDTSKQILSNSEPNVTTMMMMCNPVLDHPSGTGWNRDIHPEDMAPMDALTADFVENGPVRYRSPYLQKMDTSLYKASQRDESRKMSKQHLTTECLVDIRASYR